MHYSEGRTGRVFVIRIDHGEDVLEEISRFVRKHNILSGIIHFIGALDEGMVVTGPEEPIIPPVPHRERFSGGWEIVGTGSIMAGEDGPRIHVHAAAGRGTVTLTGCLRESARTYLIVEAIIIEFTGIVAERRFDEVTGVHLPVLEKSE